MNKLFSDLIDDKARAEYSTECPHGRWDDLSGKCQKLWRIGALDMMISEYYDRNKEAMQKLIMGEAAIVSTKTSNGNFVEFIDPERLDKPKEPR